MASISVIDGALYQWDSGRKIRITHQQGESVGLVHYSNGNAVEVVKDGDSVTAPIPNILLQTAQNVTAYAVIISADGTRTICDCTFPVRVKPKPNDYVYTETEVLTITTAVEKALQNAKESGEFDGKDGVDGKDGAPGADGYTPQKGVDYYTPEEQSALVEEISRTVTGDIEAALDDLHGYAQALVNGGEAE